MNTVANSVGVGHGRPEGLLGKLIRAYAARAAQPLLDVERHVLKIAPADPTSDRGSATNYGFLFGTGVVYGYLAEYYRGGEPSPLVAAKNARARRRQHHGARRNDPAHGQTVSRVGSYR